MARLPIAALVLAAAALAPVPPAAAQEGARPDADSPAGVEYQLPLERAREEAAGGSSARGERGGGSAGRGADDAPLFGVGIARKAGASPAGNGGSGRAASPGEGAPAPGGSARGSQGAGGAELPESVKRAAVGPAGGDGGDSGGLGIGWIVAGVLGAGAALGLALRRGLRDTSP